MHFTRSSISYLVIANIVIFALTVLASVNLSDYFALFYPENPMFYPWQYVSHLFLHGGIAHLLFNMFGLISFGIYLQQRWGNTRFLLFYFIAGLGAGLIYTLANFIQYNNIAADILALGYDEATVDHIVTSGTVNSAILAEISQQRLQELFSIYHTPAVGASGAIYGVLVAFAVLNPQAKLALIFLPVPIKAMYFVPLIITGDLFFGITRYSIGNVAHFAHIGGAIVGGLFMLALRHPALARRWP